MADRAMEPRAPSESSKCCAPWFDVRNTTTLLSIALFSSLGVLLRYGCGVLFSDYLHATSANPKRDPSGILFHDLMVNMLGSWMMGVFASFREEIQGVAPALYVGLTTGLCGCATTFSAWSSAMVVLAWDVDIGCAVYPFSGFLGTVVGFALAYAAHSVGEHAATCARHASLRHRAHRVPSAQRLRRMGESEMLRTAVDVAMEAAVVVVDSAAEHGAVDESAAAVGSDGERESDARMHARQAKAVPSERGDLAVLATVLVLWLAGTATYSALFVTSIDHYPPRALLLACIIAPVGAWTRYALTLSNAKTPTFPAYTYLCNLIGSVVSILIYVLLTKVLPGLEASGRMSEAEQAVVKEWLLAVSLGFCGCLSTVSSFVHEVATLWRKATLYEAYFYATTTMLSIHCVCLALLVPFSVYFSRAKCA